MNELAVLPRPEVEGLVAASAGTFGGGGCGTVYKVLALIAVKKTGEASCAVRFTVKSHAEGVCTSVAEELLQRAVDALPEPAS